jgi:hypothetical protein
MKHLLAFAFVAAVLAGGAHAVDVYKWKDSKGVVHYGDRPAAGASAATVSVRDDQPDPDDVAKAQQRLSEAQDRLSDDVGNDVPVAPRRSYSRPRPAADTSCAATWQRYLSAQACFDSHRAANGKGVTGTGAAVCPQLAQPDCAR